MKVTLYQTIRFDVKEVPREYKMEVEIDFLPENFWVSCGIESKVFNSWYDIETKEMGIQLEDFECNPGSFEDFCIGLEEAGWVQVG
jgi:hypothetical protein